MQSDVLTPKQIDVLWLAVQGVHSVRQQAGALRLPMNAIKNHMAAMCIRLNVQSVQEAVHIAVRDDDLVLPPEAVTEALTERMEVRRRRLVNQWKRTREAVLTFIADEYVFNRKRRLVSFNDLVRAFDYDIADLRRIVRRLERTCWIDVVMDDGTELYKPLARP